MATLVLHVAGGAALRLLLVAGGAGEALMQRIEIGTPVTSLLRLREGLFLQTLGISPYAGSAYHAAPLLLSLLGSTAGHPVLYALPLAAADAVSGLALAGFVCALRRQGRAPAVPGPAAAAALHAWNPLAVAACCGGSCGGLEAAATLCALCAAAGGRPALAALALAAAAHLSVHALLLLARRRQCAPSSCLALARGGMPQCISVLSLLD